MRISPALVVAALAVPTSLPSQSVRGQLTDSITRAPLAGAFLTLVDERGVEKARTITNNAGEFLLTAPAAGAYRLRSKRIGFRPYVSPPLTLTAGGTISYSAAVDPIPVALAQVVVRGERQCDVEAGASVAAVWEEVHEALAAVSWTSRDPAYWYAISRFARETSPGGRPRGPDSTWRDDGYRLIPVKSAPPHQLELEGFVVVDQDGWTYHGPDAEEWSLDAGLVQWYLYEIENEKVLDDATAIWDFIRCAPETPRHCSIEKQTLSEIRKKIYPFFLERNILLRPLGNVIYVLPPYVIKDDELAIIYNAIQEFLSTIE